MLSPDAHGGYRVDSISTEWPHRRSCSWIVRMQGDKIPTGKGIRHGADLKSGITIDAERSIERPLGERPRHLKGTHRAGSFQLGRQGEVRRTEV